MLDFNPRPREEGDYLRFQSIRVRTISIHALVKRATRAIFYRVTDDINFNPRPREEGDDFFVQVYKNVTRFQSTPS